VEIHVTNKKQAASGRIRSMGKKTFGRFATAIYEEGGILKIQNGGGCSWGKRGRKGGRVSRVLRNSPHKATRGGENTTWSFVVTRRLGWEWSVVSGLVVSKGEKTNWRRKRRNPGQANEVRCSVGFWWVIRGQGDEGRGVEKLNPVGQ